MPWSLKRFQEARCLHYITFSCCDRRSERSCLLRCRCSSRTLHGGCARPKGSSFWLPRYYDFNVWTEAKRIEKLRYIHRNPVRRGLVSSPEQWLWSSFRHYVSGVEGVVEIESQWTARRRELMGVTPQLASQSQDPRPVPAKDAGTRTGHPRRE